MNDLLAGIKQLRKEVRDMLPPEVKKVVHERVVLKREEIVCGEFGEVDLRNYIRINDTYNIHIVNIIRYEAMGLEKFNFYNSPFIDLSFLTKKHEIIITYIPEDNLVIVVER